MKRFKTLRFRFGLWVAGLLLSVLVIFGAFVYFSLATSLSASIDSSLQLSAAQAITAVNIENGQINFLDSVPEGPVATELSERGLTIRILDPSGHILESFGTFQSLPVDLPNLEAIRQGQSVFTTTTAETGDERVRVYTTAITEDKTLVGIVQVAQSLASVDNTLRQLLVVLLGGVPLLTLAAGLGGYVLAARALAPIDHITQTAGRISGEDLSARLNLPATPDEVGRLATTFDSMLARLDESFKRERQFTADASHELRTPLAAMQAILGVIREKPRTAEDYQQALADLSEETDRLRLLTEDLLHLARGDTQVLEIDEQVNLSALLNDVAESLRPLAEAKGLQLTAHIPEALALHGNTDGLIRLFVNLLDNAVKYTERGEITLTAQASPDCIEVTVKDTGLGIAAEHLPHIFDRFYRVDVSRSTHGAGLGLAIALDIARAHKGQLEASSLLEHGSSFTLHLPVT